MCFFLSLVFSIFFPDSSSLTFEVDLCFHNIFCTDQLFKLMHYYNNFCLSYSGLNWSIHYSSDEAALSITISKHWFLGIILTSRFTRDIVEYSNWTAWNDNDNIFDNFTNISHHVTTWFSYCKIRVTANNFWIRHFTNNDNDIRESLGFQEFRVWIFVVDYICKGIDKVLHNS